MKKENLNQVGQSGMTLVELMIAVGLTSLVMYFVSSNLVFMAQQNQKLKEKSENKTDRKIFAAKVIPLVASAGIGAQFQHLPIRVPRVGGPANQCESSTGWDDLPCVRQLLQSGSFTPAPIQVNEIIPDYLEFFRDDDARIAAPYPNAFPAPATDVVQGSSSATIATSILQGDYYVTWPLVTPSHGPLLILQNPNTSLSFRYDPTPLPAGTFISSQTTTVAAIQNLSTLVIYNLSNPAQFTVRVITAVGGVSPVFTITLGDLETAVPAGFTSGPLNYYANANSAYYLGTTFLDDFVRKPWGGIAGNPQQANLYPFPSQYFTVSNSAGPSIRNFVNTVRTRIGYENSQFIAQPVQATAYYLRPFQTIPRTQCTPVPTPVPPALNNCNIYRLVAKTYRFNGVAQNGVEIPLLDHVTRRLIFARKLGTPTIRVFEEQE